MDIFNTENKYGAVTKTIHWIIFILFIVQYFLVYRREYFVKGSPEKLQYILLHKSLGITILLLGLFFIIWRSFNKSPVVSLETKKWRIRLAQLVHFLLYVTLLAFPITGILMSQFGGRDVAFFSLGNLPHLVAENKQWGELFYTSHVWISYAVMGLVGLHVLGALYHQFYLKDKVLKSML